MDVQADEASGRPAAENEEALRDAVKAGETAEVRVLLAAGTDPDAADGNGWTALWWAAMRGHEEAVGALAEGGADLDKTSDVGESPLMAAARNGQSGVVRRLLWDLPLDVLRLVGEACLDKTRAERIEYAATM